MKRTMACLALASLSMLFAIPASALASVARWPALAAVATATESPPSAGTTDSTLKIDVLALIPDGADMTYEEFAKRASDKVAAKFAKIKPRSIKRSGNTFTLKTEGSTHTKYGITVYIGTTVTFEATKDGRILKARSIQGVEADVSMKRVTLKEVVITPLAGDQVRIDAKLEVSAYLPWIPLSMTVDKKKLQE